MRRILVLLICTILAGEGCNAPERSFRAADTGAEAGAPGVGGQGDDLSSKNGGAGGDGPGSGDSASGGATGNGGGTASGAGAGDSDVPTWCTDRVLPTDVSNVDYQCLDFDGEPPISEVWVEDVSGGSLGLVQDVASSAPTALELTSASGERSRLSWSRVGSAKLVALTVTAALHSNGFPAAPPPWEGSAELLCVEIGGGTACLHYQWGGAGDTYFVRVVPSLVKVPKDCPMSAELTIGDWTRVELSALSTGQVLLRLNSVNVLDGCNNQFSSATTGKATIGLSLTNTSSAYTVDYDNVEVSLAR